MASPTTVITLIAGSTVILGFLGKLLQVSYKAYRRNEATQEFTVQMATNHLPHLYHTLTLICKSLGIEVTEPHPPINFTDYKGDKE